jgi:hypothetical protein
MDEIQGIVTMLAGLVGLAMTSEVHGSDYLVLRHPDRFPEGFEAIGKAVSLGWQGLQDPCHPGYT